MDSQGQHHKNGIAASPEKSAPGGPGAFASGLTKALFAAPCLYESPTFVRDGLLEDLPSSSAAVIRSLVDDLRATFLAPAVASSTTEAFFALIAAHWRDFKQTADTIQTIVRSSVTAQRRARHAQQGEIALGAKIHSAVRTLGEDASEEVAFCQETYHSATTIASGFSTQVREEDRAADRKLCRAFHEGAELHLLGSLMLLEAETSAERTKVAVRASLEVLRQGALQAYAAAREAQELRNSDEPQADDLPWDEEDARLSADLVRESP